MKNVIYELKSADPAPKGGGDSRSWFFYYKFRPKEEEDFFVPHPTLSADAGDIIWFVMDDQFVGCVPALRTEWNHFDSSYELWYRGQNILEFDMEYNEESIAAVHNGELWKRVSHQFK